MFKNGLNGYERCDRKALHRWENEGGCVAKRNVPSANEMVNGPKRRAAMGHHDLTLTDADRRRLGTLLTSAEAAAYGRANSRFNLETIVEMAKAIPAARTPSTLVTMNSTVVLVDVASGERRTCTLVYPEDRDLFPHGVGVLQQSGQRLLGRSLGDIVQLADGAKSRQFRIESIPYQPEAAGAGHL